MEENNMNKEEPKLTRQEWLDAERAINTIASVRRTLVGSRIKDKETYNKIIHEVRLVTCQEVFEQ